MTDEIPFLPGKVLLWRLAGSHIYNLNIPDSDKDYAGVYVANASDMLSLSPPPESKCSNENDKPDYNAHEVLKFCHLLLKGNPSVIESLFLKDEFVLFSMPQWWVLWQEGRRFLSRAVVSSCIGYATSQLHKLSIKHGLEGLHTKGGQYNPKFGMHLIRLLEMAEEIIEGRFRSVFLEHGDPLRNFLMDVRSGKYSQREVAVAGNARLDRVIAKFDSPNCNLPRTGDRDFLNDWLLRLRGDTIWG
jgi:predicted nucleotidyltransferase